MAAAIGFMGLAGILGSISGGINARKEQEVVKHQVCQIYNNMIQYQKNMRQNG